MKRLYKILLGILLLLAAGIVVLVAVSPYGSQEGYDYKLVKHTVNIKAPIDSVFRFLGNSNNARKWSVFVHHITPLNADSLPDGMPGSRRRCFCKADETGIVWDETITERITNKKRQLICYDMHGFPLSVSGIATEQLYDPMPDGSCNLTFSFFIKDHKPSLWETMKLHIGSFRLHSIFKRNIENVKAICEGGQAIHPRE